MKWPNRAENNYLIYFQNQPLNKLFIKAISNSLAHRKNHQKSLSHFALGRFDFNLIFKTQPIKSANIFGF